jgi:hypothetical protein
MATLITVDIKGAKEIEEVLDMLPPKVRGRLMLSALRTGGNLVRTAYRRRIPTRKEPGPKRIKKGGAKGRLPGFGRASVIVAKKRGESEAVEVGASRRAFYLRILEFGGRWWAPRGWLRAAWIEQQAAVLAKVGGYLWVNIQRYAERKARKT